MSERMGRVSGPDGEMVDLDALSAEADYYEGQIGKSGGNAPAPARSVMVAKDPGNGLWYSVVLAGVTITSCQLSEYHLAAIVFAPARSNAKWIAVRSYWDSFGRDKAWPQVVARRAREYDASPMQNGSRVWDEQYLKEARHE